MESRARRSLDEAESGGPNVMRRPEVAKWQQKFRVDWDATDGRNGGAQRRVWEVLMEMVR